MSINKRRTYAKDDNYNLSPPESPLPASVDLAQEGAEFNGEEWNVALDKSNGNSLIWHPFKQSERALKDEFSGKRHNSTTKNELWIVLVLSVLSLATRWYKAGWANRSIWDEAYFGKYGLNYIKHEFFHDVHPPLGKMLVGFAGKLAGYTGNFLFDSGNLFPEDLNHGLMRMFVSSFGAAIVPFGFMTAKYIGLSQRCRFLTAIFLLFDNGMIVISKFLLLDPFLLCFTSATVCAWARFHSFRFRPFSSGWRTSMVFLGASMGLNCSVKWGVPLFLVALIGLYTIHELWMLFNDPKVSRNSYLKHWAFRIFGLFLLPGAIYLFSFKIHFGLLTKIGTESYAMDSVFISKLEGSGLDHNCIEIGNGANVTMRATILNGGLLHSHDHDYPSGSKEKQVTSFRELDYNNHWSVEIQDVRPTGSVLEDGNILKLIHQGSGLLLTAQPGIDSPVQGSAAYEVSASHPSQNSLWKVRIYDDRQSWHISTVNAITTRFQLESVHGKCLLASADRHLPAWGFKQLEVNCIRDLSSIGVETLWNFEFNQHPQLALAPKGHIRSRFAWDIYRIHHAMWSTNVGLIPDPDKFDPLASVALDWPLLRRGIRMSSWKDSDIKVFMFGNPIIWWGSSFGVILFILQCAICAVRLHRKINPWSPGELSRFIFIRYAVFGGWCIHFLPFFFMTRVLYLHHYFPSLYFALLLAPYSLELSLAFFSQKTISCVFVLVALSSLISFMLFSPLTYGFDYPPSEISYLQWLDSWKFI